MGRRYAMAVEIALTIFFSNFFFFFRHLFTPGEKGRNTAILGPTDFFRTLAHAGWCEEQKNNGIRLKKHPKIQENHRLWDRANEMVCVIITDFTYGTEEVSALNRTARESARDISPPHALAFIGVRCVSCFLIHNTSRHQGLLQSCWQYCREGRPLSS